MGVRILGTAGYVPDHLITNEHLEKRFGCDREWIVKQTGIRERRHALPHQATSDLAIEAATRCLQAADAVASDVDLLLVATCTPDMSFPSTACLVQDRLKLKCPAVDLQAACAGFVYALVTGSAYINSGACDKALIIGADCLSRTVNPEDLKIYPLLGDGAGAVILGRGTPDQGLVRYSMGSQGSGRKLIQRQACGSRLPPTPELLERRLHYMEMEGRQVFNWAASILCDSIQEVLRAAEMKVEDVDLYVPHQANLRIINASIDVLRIDRRKVFTNIEKYGNTSAASIPLALAEADASDRIHAGDHVMLSGFGAGLVWGTALVRW
ncbi:MAG: ketoacyl-ACP synthase III [Planctomycetes bacterium]|nr:ketoacyl-ACP synthase III [Planctomycetota bacterium]